MSRKVWRERWLLWTLPTALLLLNLALLIGYRVAFADRVGALRSEVEREQAELDRLVSQREQLAALVSRARASKEGIDELYRERFATEAERLTQLIREVKELAERAGLTPRAFDYPEQELDDSGLIERSIVFSVSGDYAALRRFVNFLELSEEYVVLRSIRLQRGDGQLNLSVELSTLFTGRDQRSQRRVEA